MSRAGARVGARWLPGDYEIVPNGVLDPRTAPIPRGREHRVVFVGRHEPRKGLHVLLRAWPEIHRAHRRAAAASSAPTRSRCGSSSTRLRVPDDGIDVLGFLAEEELTDELARREGAGRAVARRRELRDGADARASRAPPRSSRPTSPGYRDGASTPETARCSFRPATPARSRARSSALLDDEPRRAAARRGRAAARVERYAWSDIARRLVEIYERLRRRATSRSPREVRPRSPLAPGSRSCSSSRLVAVVARSGGAGRLGARRPTRSRSSSWRWVVVAIALNLLSVARALARVAADDRPGARPAAPALPTRSSRRSRSACSRTRCCRAGSASSRASPSCGGTCRTDAGRRATLVGTVFAHRALRPRARRSLLVSVRLLTAKIPHWAVTSLIVVVGRRGRASSRSRSRARSGTTGPSARRGRRRCADCSCMARQGLAVHAVAAAGAGGDRPPVRSAGSSSCSPCTWRCARSTSTSRCRRPGSCCC